MSWEWFFRQLSVFVASSEGLVFVSDRHTSIYKAVSKVKYSLDTIFIYLCVYRYYE